MVFSLLTVVFYTASSLGDKYISAKLACSAQEFSFLVALSTAFFLTLVLPFTGWNFAFSLQSGLALVVLVALKIAEFYTSAALLKTVSAYELKAWLSLNVIISYLVDLARNGDLLLGIPPLRRRACCGHRTGRLRRKAGKAAALYSTEHYLHCL